jgi:predicted nucleic acid-binding protein
MFVDTNVLVHAAVPAAAERQRARVALAHHVAGGEPLCISRQVLREFVAVITRPQFWMQAMTPVDAAAAAQQMA